MTEAAQPSYPVAQGELDQFWELARASGMITSLFHTKLAEHLAISITDHKCLHLVLSAGERLSAGQLAAMSGLSTGAVTGVIDRLEQSGYLQRVRDQEDRRKILLEASPAGREMYAGLLRSTMNTMRRVLARYSPQHRQLIHDYTIDLLTEMRREVARFPNTTPQTG